MTPTRPHKPRQVWDELRNKAKSGQRATGCARGPPLEGSGARRDLGGWRRVPQGRARPCQSLTSGLAPLGKRWGSAGGWWAVGPEFRDDWTPASGEQSGSPCPPPALVAAWGQAPRCHFPFPQARPPTPMPRLCGHAGSRGSGGWDSAPWGPGVKSAQNTGAFPALHCETIFLELTVPF